MSKNNIVLIGYMGAGKTTVGNALAAARGMKLIDTDDVISRTEHRSINDIFAQESEEYFRDLETRLLEKMCEELENTVVSCGGGMPLREINRTYLKKLGSVIYLKVSAETVYARLKDDTTRPLLKGDASSAMQRISDMIASRDPLYTEAADIIINADDLSADDIAKQIGDML